MLNVALTGNIAAGKSTVVKLLRRWGATIIDADELAREAEAPGTEVLTAIVKRFGTNVLHRDGTLDRPALRAKVIGDDAALADLNAIVHPAVRRRRDELLAAARARNDVLVVNDIPLLFEALDPSQFDAVVLVDAPVPVRRARLRALRFLPVAGRRISRCGRARSNGVPRRRLTDARRSRSCRRIRTSRPRPGSPARKDRAGFR